MFYGHRVDTQEVDTCRGPHSPRLRWPSPLVTVGTGYGAISPLQPTSIPSTWDPAPVPPGSCLGPREQRREGGAMETPGGTASPTQSVPGPSPPVPCAPQTSLLSVLLHRAHSPQSLRKCCSLGLKDFSSASRLNGNIPFRPCSLSKSCHTRLQPPCALLLSHPCPSAWHNHSRCPVQMSTRGQGHHYYPCPSRAGQSIHQPNL